MMLFLGIPPGMLAVSQIFCVNTSDHAQHCVLALNLLRDCQKPHRSYAMYRGSSRGYRPLGRSTTCFLDIQAVHLGGVWLGAQLVHAVALGVSDDPALSARHLSHCSGAAQLLYQRVQEVWRQRQCINPLRGMGLSICAALAM